MVELETLRPHPVYLRHGITVSSRKVTALMALGDFAFKDPLVIASGGVVLDGYARWEVAKRQAELPFPVLSTSLGRRTLYAGS